jgi:hypothetical protein
MLRIKKKYLNQTILNGREIYKLNNSLTQTELLYIGNHINSIYIEEYTPKIKKPNIEDDTNN